MTWCVMSIGKERLYMDMRDLYAVMERPGGKAVDIYSTLFPDGITVDHTFDEVTTLHESLAQETYEVEFEMDPNLLEVASD